MAEKPMDDGRYYLLDLVRVRATYPELIRQVKAGIEIHNPDIVLIEDAGSGSSLIADLESQGLSTTPVKARLDKETRLSRVAAMIENGNVYLPRDAHWKDDFLYEVFAFPSGRHDDQVHDAGVNLDEGREHQGVGLRWEVQPALVTTGYRRRPSGSSCRSGIRAEQRPLCAPIADVQANFAST